MVLDSSAIDAIFKQEPGCEILERKIDEAEAVLIGAPTLVETALVLARQTGRDQRILLEAYLRRIDAHVVDFSESHYLLAGEAFMRFGRGFNSKANLNFGDCLAYAVAALARDKLLFVGDDFRQTDVDVA